MGRIEALSDEVWQPQSNTHAPEGSAQRTGAATLRALDAFLEQQQLCRPERILEIASGFGHHASIITSAWSDTKMQTTEAQDECLAALEKLSIDNQQSLLLPHKLNVLDERHWESLEDSPLYGAIYCSNLIHISPWSTTAALFKHAAKLLTEPGWVFLYGPYLRDGNFTSEGDEKFDASLRSRDPAFGLRDPVEVDKVAAQYGFKRVFEADMPSNNKAFAWMR